MVTEEKLGPTPNGGVRSEIRYLDSNGQPVDKKKATRAIILEYNSDNEVIQRTYGTIGK